MTIFYLIKVPLLYFFGASENIPFLKSLKSTPTEKQTDVVLKPLKKGCYHHHCERTRLCG